MFFSYFKKIPLVGCAVQHKTAKLVKWAIHRKISLNGSKNCGKSTRSHRRNFPSAPAYRTNIIRPLRQGLKRSCGFPPLSDWRTPTALRSGNFLRHLSPGHPLSLQNSKSDLVTRVYSGEYSKILKIEQIPRPQQSAFPKAFPGGGWWVCLWLARIPPLPFNASGFPFGKL